MLKKCGMRHLASKEQISTAILSTILDFFLQICAKVLQVMFSVISSN